MVRCNNSVLQVKILDVMYCINLPFFMNLEIEDGMHLAGISSNLPFGYKLSARSLYFVPRDAMQVLHGTPEIKT